MDKLLNMPGYIFKPSTNNKNDKLYKQIGANCWYYASEIILTSFDSTNEDSYFNKKIKGKAQESMDLRDMYMKTDKSRLSDAFSDTFGKDIKNQTQYLQLIGFHEIGNMFTQHKKIPILEYDEYLKNGPLLCFGMFGRPSSKTNGPIINKIHNLEKQDPDSYYSINVDLFMGGNHAIVLLGIDIHQKKVFYTDPNYAYTNKVLKIDFDTFTKNLNSIYLYRGFYNYEKIIAIEQFNDC